MTRHNPYRHQLDRMADELIDKTIGTDAIELTRRMPMELVCSGTQVRHQRTVARGSSTGVTRG